MKETYERDVWKRPIKRDVEERLMTDTYERDM